jgi:hypothetical protein
MQCNYSSAYLGYNIQLKVSALILEIYRHVEAHYTAYLMPNTAHILQFFAMWMMDPDIYNEITAPHIEASIFD